MYRLHIYDDTHISVTILCIELLGVHVTGTRFYLFYR